jgi:hypothetical protein
MAYPSIIYRTRAEALAAGARRYLSRSICPRGHLAWRFTSTGNCITCTRRAGRRALAARGFVALQFDVRPGLWGEFREMLAAFQGFDTSGPPEVWVQVPEAVAEDFRAAVGPMVEGCG